MSDMKNLTQINSVPSVSGKDLEAKGLWKLFETGAKAVSLEGDPRINQLWEGVVSNSGWNGFWNNSVFTFAKNSFPSTTDYGDFFRFERETTGVIARKVVVFPDLETGLMQTYPKLFNDNGEIATLSQSTLKQAWDLAMDVTASATPHENLNPSDLVVHLELLKYPDSYQDFQKLIRLVDIGSSWKKVGIKLDHSRAVARGLFSKRFIRDLFAWVSLLPWFGKRFQSMNHALEDKGFHERGKGYAALGEAHVDGCRFLTVMASDRDVVNTEVYDGKKWVQLPMKTCNLSIFPASDFDPEKRVGPTIHRFSIREDAPESTQRKQNLTLLMGISTRKMFEKRKPVMH